MSTQLVPEAGQGLDDAALPRYMEALHAYHCAREVELKAIIAGLPIAAKSHVLDVGSGDGCHAMWLAERAGSVIGVDRSPACVELARRRCASLLRSGRVSFEMADAATLPFAQGCFELTWCAHSLSSLPDRVATLRELSRVTRAGGHVAVLENDILNNVLLPWPPELELAVRRARLQTLTGVARQAGQSLEKFYGSRGLIEAFRACGLTACTIQTFSVERHAPLAPAEEVFLLDYLDDLRGRAFPNLERSAQEEFDRLFEPSSEACVLRSEDFHYAHLEVLTTGQVRRETGLQSTGIERGDP
jgi:ubiquinone/menaquinone biosynthesis C-methylase UbiE